MSAPFGRRLCEVAANRDSGGYRVVSLVDREGPEPLPGQFYMLAAVDGWDSRDGRAFLPRAISVADVNPAAGGGLLEFFQQRRRAAELSDRVEALDAGRGERVEGEATESEGVGAGRADHVGGSAGIRDSDGCLQKCGSQQPASGCETSQYQAIVH